MTIHYSGRLRDDRSLEAVRAVAREHAEFNGWSLESLDRDHDALSRFEDGREWTREGPVRGVVVRPGGHCESVWLEFDADGFAQGSTKTQFAGVSTHCAVVALLRDVAPHLDDFDVVDEGGFWETGDLPELERRIAFLDEAIARLREVLPDDDADEEDQADEEDE